MLHKYKVHISKVIEINDGNAHWAMSAEGSPSPVPALT